jgi:hypothetical protein
MYPVDNTNQNNHKPRVVPSFNELPILEPGAVLAGPQTSNATVEAGLQEPNRYEIIRRLGMGLTAQVYLARRLDDQRNVALKVLRTDVSEISRQHFWDEASIIAELVNKGEISCVPRVQEKKENATWEGDPLFLVMDYIDDEIFQPVSKLVEAAPLPEQEALELAVQALDLFDRLHTRVQRTYIDMQLQNFWWSSVQNRLFVTDWNHVSPQRQEIEGYPLLDEPLRSQRLAELASWGAADFPGLVRNDLGRFAAYLYQMLTSKGARASGETSSLAGKAGR